MIKGSTPVSIPLHSEGEREAELTRRHDHEPSRVPIAHDGGEDDRTAGWQGVLRLPFLVSLLDLNRNLLFFGFVPTGRCVDRKTPIWHCFWRVEGI